MKILNIYSSKITVDYTTLSLFSNLINKIIYIYIIFNIKLFFIIRNVAEFLGSSKEEAEIWIVSLIRNVNIEAKIDSDKG